MLHVVHGAARASESRVPVEGRPGNVGRHRPALGRPAAQNLGAIARAEISTPTAGYHTRSGGRLRSPVCTPELSETAVMAVSVLKIAR